MIILEAFPYIGFLVLFIVLVTPVLMMMEDDEAVRVSRSSADFPPGGSFIKEGKE